jgi:hypothetical protein
MLSGIVRLRNIRDTVLQRSGSGRECANTFRGFERTGMVTFGTLFRNELRKFLRSCPPCWFLFVLPTCRGSVGFVNGHMITNAFSLVRFSCERVLGLFCTDAVSNTPPSHSQYNAIHFFCILRQQLTWGFPSSVNSAWKRLDILKVGKHGVSHSWSTQF